MRLPGTKSVREVAVLLETSDSRVLEMIQEGKFKPINTSRGSVRPRWAIPTEQVEALKQPEQETVKATDLVPKPKKRHV